MPRARCARRDIPRAFEILEAMNKTRYTVMETGCA
jgi:hypothetical protein